MVDEVQIADMCRRYGSSILRRCRSILREEAAAEDVAQEVFIAIMANASRFRGESDIGTWIYRITTNLCLNHLRATKRRASREQAAWMPDSQSGPDRSYEVRNTLDDLVKDLDPLAQEVLVLRFLDGLSLEEIATVTGRSRRTIGKRLKEIQRRIGG